MSMSNMRFVAAVAATVIAWALLGGALAWLAIASVERATAGQRNALACETEHPSCDAEAYAAFRGHRMR